MMVPEGHICGQTKPILYQNKRRRDMDSIIFDLDGTLWDSRQTVMFVWNNVLKEKGLNRELTEEDFKQTMGLQVPEVGQKLFPELAEEFRTQLLDECCEVECDYLKEQGGTLYGDVENVLKELSNSYKLFIVSNCQEGYIEAFYDYHKLGKYFLDYENPGRTGLSKGENIKLIMERNKLTNPVYVGDTEGDRKAAELAGIPFIYARYGFGHVEQFDYAIDQFKELLDIDVL
jgi:phosphoglycolate phosphatase